MSSLPQGASSLEILSEPAKPTATGWAPVAERLDELRQKVKEGMLVTIRDVMTKQTDFHLVRPDLHPESWRRKKRRKKQQDEERTDSQKDKKKDQDQQKQEEKDKGEKPKLATEKQALLDCLRYEQQYRSSMRRNDGKGFSPYKNDDAHLFAQIDEADQSSLDSWIPRSDKLIRLTGKHPMNAEVELFTLFDAGLITPTSIHYVRNHGAVPHLLWENHTLEVEVGNNLTLEMNDPKDRFESANIPILLACDGNRRKELNIIKEIRAFNYTAAASSCAYWKGNAWLVDENPDRHFWVKFEGVDQLEDAKYAKCIPLE
ncbi:uncharacterized protein DSM5745_01870 [Aspergillus mulundensis]|uniref:Oxidoreductase molybdopterin-binding domain-containing protein n=1 Tax=Aspergillus mulundensis TaxID=1810919 RepID=A0A3D8SUX7_9EURO|nr:hypothetical protein DSM5745_01870 [Aspergillus mulundensis]RDW90095.1 hypothetical protein DSM5745_01870 [Aspergillus mulundensis]